MKRQKQQEKAASPDNDYRLGFDCLCEILNWTAKEATTEEAYLVELVDMWEKRTKVPSSPLFSVQDLLPRHFHQGRPEGFLGVIALLRALAPRVIAHKPGPRERELSADLIAQRLEPIPLWEDLELSEDEHVTLNFVANQNPVHFLLCLGGAATKSLAGAFVDHKYAESTWILAESEFYPDLSRLILATRSLWPILAGEARLRRCPAPAPGGDLARKCGRYFVSGGKVGRPALFCCENCGKRDSRVRKKARERGGVRGN